jgi:hypothetical protein
MFLAPTIVLSQIQTEHLTGFWCVNQVTSLNEDSGEEQLEEQITQDFAGIAMAFNEDSTYYVFFLELHFAEYLTLADFHYYPEDSLIEVIYTEESEIEGASEISDVIYYGVEMITENKMVFSTEDEETGSTLFYYFYRCEVPE